MARKRQYRSGSVRQKNGRYYIRFYRDGKQVEESAGENEAAAKRLLAQRLGETMSGSAIQKAGVDVTIGDCLDALLENYSQRGKSVTAEKYRIKSTIRPSIGWIKAARFGRKQIWQYIAERRAVPVKDSTINRELSLIRHSLKLAASDEYAMISRAPDVPMLDEGDNVRTGFLTPAEYARMRDALPEYLRPLIVVAYYTGLRRGTLLSLRLNQVDLDAGLIWVSRVQTKNRMSQTAPIIDGEMRSVCAHAIASNRRFLFERDGHEITSFKNAWATAAKEAKLPNLRFHDLRRTAVRDWIAAGASESTVMAISGHKTQAMLQRYNIIDAAKIQKAAKLRNSEVAPVEIEIREEQGKNPSRLPS